MDVKSASRILDLFEAFGQVKCALTLKELADHIKAPMSSCLGLVRTVEARGYLYTVKGRSLYPTRRLYDLAREVLEHDPVVSRAGEVLAALRDETGESVCIARRRDLLTVYLDVYDSPHRIRYIVHPGETRELHCNSIGKAILAQLPATERASIMDRLPYTVFSPATLRNKEALQRDLELSAARGWFANRGETEPEAFGIAAPVRIAGDWYGVSIVGPNSRVERRLDEHLAALRRAIDQITRANERRLVAPELA